MFRTIKKAGNSVFLITLSLSAALVLSSCANDNKPLTKPAHYASSEKPNIIFFFTDDQAYDTIRAFGNPDAVTPNIDKLANNGVVFSRHYNTTSICMASRASVMSGMYEYKNGTNFQHGPMAETIWQQSYPLLLKQAGYRTGFAGKFGFPVSNMSASELNKEEGKVAQHDFDFWAGGPGQTSYKTAQNESIKKYAQDYPHSSLAYGAVSVDFIRDAVKDNTPFAMSVFYKAPHRPVTPDRKFDDVYKNTEFRKLPNYGRDAGKHFSKHSQKGRQYPRFEEWGYSEAQTYQQALRKYHQLIHGIDQSIGMVLTELETLGIADNTVIIFASDNGYFNGSHGLGSKVLPYEEGARVPLIIYDPRNQQSGKMRTTTSLTAGVDISATILDFAGVSKPISWDGVSLVPILNDSNQRVRKTMPHIQVWGLEETRNLTVLDQRFKYIYWYYQDEQQDLVPTEELYDLANDPYELTNVVSDIRYASTLENMRAVYDQQINHWQQHSVKYNEYAEYGQLFDRHLSWPAKQQILNKKGIADQE
ncbi:sulfatase [Paraglaciecola aquimarina]|uniref:Sulfatase n=1 Tax=Paraglaciecola aquimarina TaxID=1235557 RepID=A0ABU3SWU4_9ALTE|nr:sulfatase [Paraglaciecola aquimarina]MDU0354453.1 sulfatase [Paraglaciecola aquimarina]